MRKFNSSIKGLSVTVRDGNYGVDKALRKFKKKVEEDGRLKTAKEKQEYVSPSERKRIDKKRAISRHKKKLRDESRNDNKYR